MLPRAIVRNTGSGAFNRSGGCVDSRVTMKQWIANCVGQFEISVLGSLKLRCQELVEFSGLQRRSLFIRNDDLPSLAGPNARLGNRNQHADAFAAYFLVLSCRYNLICQLGDSSIRTRHLVLPLWLQFAVKVTIWRQILAERAPRSNELLQLRVQTPNSCESFQVWGAMPWQKKQPLEFFGFLRV